jgi:cysteine desulfurase
LIYLDNNATTPIDPQVVDAMLPFLREHFANPSAAYRSARGVDRAIATARAQVAALIHAEPEEIIFTSGGTESNNTAIDSAMSRWPERKHLIIGATEHPAVIEPANRWQERGGTVTRLRGNRLGHIDLAELRTTLREHPTALVSVMWANNETGVIAPIAEIAAIAHEAGALFHTDAVQAVGKLPIDVRACGIDFLSLSGHKFHAPKGIGALFASRRVGFRPWLLGGGQEHGRRSGTENVAGIVALGVAAELALKAAHAAVRGLRDEFESLVGGALINGDPVQRLGTTSSLCFPGIDAAGMLILLDERGVCCSAGSACHSAAVHPSPVLEAMGLNAAHAASTLRFSFSRFNTLHEAREAARLVNECAAKMRSLAGEGMVAMAE